ncbi:adaptor protein MecA [Domibacillus sp. DTU_2020_1001157_1_SI_ALB_TIR_016]|uniref:adaptor protein MecA n=1 Tax=Domibacillus sp. DTU_2020_1001157_1_SI_ALB_TIR_016 TaxID=3077789 RepID=UPI0028E8934D|nr:adaptor protein MecA [Domibacillus sp. DTU_2020_1001157_1_SI_ALB_TIR_016]WNS80048.1 adaptor protein MecA [Domibacillus sp. DTU_2020_1001157_1_SI_ALB_TIR_016]
MEIERINDNTVKFFISYVDIEERGFDREEIWYNRERSEELFWDMMEEVHDEEDFTVDGPLWIQVHALDKGLEILVTQANLTKDGQRLELPFTSDKMDVNGQIEDLLDEHFDRSEEDDAPLDFVLAFRDFEDVIALSNRGGLDYLTTSLYVHENRYYLFVEFADDRFQEEEIDDALSILLEYTHESRMTIHTLQEYGKCIMPENVFETVRQYFS